MQKEEEPCKKGLRNKLFEYRYRNHVERYWLPVPCVECQRKAKRGVVLVDRDENGQIFPRTAPGVDCQRDISDELDLDMRGDIVSKRSLWSPLLAHHYSAHRGGAGKNRLPINQDNANQTTPILVDEDELPPSYTITPGPCISGHRAISLAPIYNGTIILPCTTLEKRGRKKHCMENRTLLIEFRNVTHRSEVLLPCGRELSLLPKNASVSENSTAPGRNETFDLKIEGQKRSWVCGAGEEGFCVGTLQERTADDGGDICLHHEGRGESYAPPLQHSEATAEEISGVAASEEAS